MAGVLALRSRPCVNATAVAQHRIVMPSVSASLFSVVVVFATAAIWPSAESYRVDKYSLLMPNVQPKKVSDCICTAALVHYKNINIVDRRKIENK